MQDDEYIFLARELAPEAEKILGVRGVIAELDSLSENPAARAEALKRDIGIGDIGSVAGALISLFMWIDQIHRKQILLNASREEIIRDLTIRVLDSKDLSNAAKERLVGRALDLLPPDGR